MFSEWWYLSSNDHGYYYKYYSFALQACRVKKSIAFVLVSYWKKQICKWSNIERWNVLGL